MVHNHAKLAYNGVAAWLDGTGPAPARVAAVPGVDEQLRVQDRVAQLLRARRLEHGALTLETVEARAVFDDGALTDLVPERRNRAKELIEDLMIAANGATARFLEQKGFASLRRVLRSPERWAKIVELAASLGEKLPPEPSNAALDAFLQKRAPGRSRALRRSLGLGREASRPRRVRGGAPGPAAAAATSGSRSATTRTRPRRTAASPT